jgi:hypothetical protein
LDRDRSNQAWGTTAAGEQPQPSAPTEPFYDDEPTFSDEDADPFEPDSFGDEPGWRSSLASSTAMDFQLPSFHKAATGTDAPLCLLIPTPVTDMDDLAALLRFVAATQSTMARSVDEVPAGSRVSLIGTTGTEEWTEIEQQLSSRGLTYERVQRRLSEALADDSLFGL